MKRILIWAIVPVTLCALFVIITLAKPVEAKETEVVIDLGGDEIFYEIDVFENGYVSPGMNGKCHVKLSNSTTKDLNLTVYVYSVIEPVGTYIPIKARLVENTTDNTPYSDIGRLEVTRTLVINSFAINEYCLQWYWPLNENDELDTLLSRINPNVKIVFEVYAEEPLPIDGDGGDKESIDGDGTGADNDKESGNGDGSSTDNDKDNNNKDNKDSDKDTGGLNGNGSFDGDYDDDYDSDDYGSGNDNGKSKYDTYVKRKRSSDTAEAKISLSTLNEHISTSPPYLTTDGWYWLLSDDGSIKCYYFDIYGNCLYDGLTDDGYRVNEKGEWVIDSKAVTYTPPESPDDIYKTPIMGKWVYYNDLDKWSLFMGTKKLTGWHYAHNPYAIEFRDRFDWFYFNDEGYMASGEMNINDRKYSFHEVSDGTRGHLLRWLYEKDF
ncbi:MAG: hypothetical protein Q4B67_06805 [Eubacteriales bacterium]|nr:hypothetical protein [Eubacteriales bacterium]